MSIGGVGNQTKPDVPQNVSQKGRSSDSIDSLARQRENLTKRLEAIKSRPKNSQAEQNAAAARKQSLENQIAMIH